MLVPKLVELALFENVQLVLKRVHFDGNRYRIILRGVEPSLRSSEGTKAEELEA